MKSEPVTSYLPLRVIAERAGIEVAWDGETRTIALKHGADAAEPWQGMTLDKNIVTVLKQTNRQMVEIN